MSGLVVLRPSPASALDNMTKDYHLLTDMDKDDPVTLHLYHWSQPSITYGHFSRIEEQVDLHQIKKHYWSIAKRPTGGGILVHSWDLTFSLLIPQQSPLYRSETIESYAYINTIVSKALLTAFPSLQEDLHAYIPNSKESSPTFCMSSPTIYDLLYKKYKILGAAQRRKQQGILHQCSINLFLPPYDIINTFFKDPQIPHLIENGSIDLSSITKTTIIKKSLENILIEQIEKVLIEATAL